MSIGVNQPVVDIRTSANLSSTRDKKPIKFEKCIGCPDIGPSCLGPNLLVLTIPELRVWVNRWREYYNLSISKCAAAWDMPEGTIARFLSSSESDFKYATVRGIIQGVIRYGQPAEQDFGNTPCPATSQEIQDQVSEYQKQLAEKTEECVNLSARKLERANEYAERMADQREHYEKNLSEREKSVSFLRDLAEKRQRDLEKAEAISTNYLQRIDAKNKQLEERDAEIRSLHTEILKISAAHNEEIKGLIDRILRMSEAHAAEVKAITQFK